MATRTSYTYTKVILPDQLATEIHNSSIVTALDVVVLDGTNNVTVWFKDVLSEGDITILSGLVTSHTPVPFVDTPQAVSISNTPTFKREFSPTQADVFGEPYTNSGTIIFTAHFCNDIHSDLFEKKEVNGGEVTHVPASILLSTTTADGSRAIYQSRRKIQYIPGTSLEGKFTQVFSAPLANLHERSGLFFNDEGFFFENNVDGVCVVLRSKASGSVVETKIKRADWDDPNLEIDFSYGQILLIRYQWLGYGKVEYLAATPTGIEVCHTISHFNILTAPYTIACSFPVRFEIENIGAVASANTFRCGCFSVKSIGDSLIGNSYCSASNGTTGISISSTSLVPVVSIRLKSTHVNAEVTMDDCLLLLTTDSDVYYELVINSTLTSASWAGNSAFTEKDVAATASSGGRVIKTGYLSKKGEHSVTLNKVFDRLSGSIDGVADILTIRAITLSGNATMFSTISYREIG